MNRIQLNIKRLDEKTLRWGFAVLIAAIVLVGFISGRATATGIDSIWDLGGSGDWEKPTNWNPDGVPNNGGGNTYNVFINDNVSQVSLNSTVTIDNLTTDFGNVLLNSGSFSSLSIANSGGIENYSEINNDDIIDNSGSIVNDGGINNYGGIDNSGSIVNNWGIENSGGIDNSGSIVNNEGIENSGGIDNSGSIVNDGGIVNSGGINNIGNIDNFNSIDNEGAIVNYGEIDNSWEILSEGDIINNKNIDNSGDIVNEGAIVNEWNIDNSGILYNVGAITNNGEIINDWYLVNEGEMLNTNAVTVGDSGIISVDGNYTQTAGITHLTDATGILEANIFDLQGGVLSGFGTVAADVISAGEINPGAAPGSMSVIPGSMNIEGDYTQLVDGILNMEIASLSSFDKFLISDVAMLHGTLNVSLLDGFLPSVGDSFEIMTFDSHIDEFDVMNGLALGGGLFFDPIFSDTDLTLVTQQSEPIPEPTTIYLMGFGILGLLVIGIRQRRKNKDV